MKQKENRILDFLIFGADRLIPSPFWTFSTFCDISFFGGSPKSFLVTLSFEFVLFVGLYLFWNKLLSISG